MRVFRCYAFLDGAYLRQRADEASVRWVDPRAFADILCRLNSARSSGSKFGNGDDLHLHRTLYYDAVPDDSPSEDLETYWKAIQLLPDTSLGFGSLIRTPQGRRRQKGVDTLLAVEMLSAAYDKLFDLALLVAGDADFVPLLNEVRRRGVHVLLAACEGHCAEELRRSADRFVLFDPAMQGGPYKELLIDGQGWGPGTTPN